MRETVAGQPNGRQLVGLTAWCRVVQYDVWKGVDRMEEDGEGCR